MFSRLDHLQHNMVELVNLCFKTTSHWYEMVGT